MGRIHQGGSSRSLSFMSIMPHRIWNALSLLHFIWRALSWRGINGCCVMDKFLRALVFCRHQRLVLLHHSMKTLLEPYSSSSNTGWSMSICRNLKLQRTVLLAYFLLFLLSCFISRLAPKIRSEVQAFQPLTLIQAAAFARLQEEKFANSHQLLH